MKSRIWMLAALLGAAAWPAGKDSFEIAGFVGKSSMEAAAGVTVKLLDGATGETLDTVQTGWTGRYKFKELKPGAYVLQVGEVKREVQLKARNLRMDIDLSAKDGAMRYAKAEDVQKAVSAVAAGGAAAPAGPNDPQLMERFAGHYWGYSGSTEVNLGLCADGTFVEQAESSYSGTSRDSLGNQTMAWGTANQSGNRGNWSIQGTLQSGTIVRSYANGRRSSVPYRQVDAGCYNLNGRTVCRKGAAVCR